MQLLPIFNFFYTFLEKMYTLVSEDRNRVLLHIRLVTQWHSMFEFSDAFLEKIYMSVSEHRNNVLLLIKLRSDILFEVLDAFFEKIKCRYQIIVTCLNSYLKVYHND